MKTKKVQKVFAEFVPERGYQKQQKVFEPLRNFIGCGMLKCNINEPHPVNVAECTERTAKCGKKTEKTVD